MVRAAPTTGGHGDGTGGGSIRRRESQGMEWSLRALRKIDAGGQHFLQNYYSDSDEESDHLDEEDQTAYEIFKAKPTDMDKAQNGHHKSHNGYNGSGESNMTSTGNLHRPGSVWATLNAPLRTGVVDGRKVIFELQSNVTKKPETPRQERLHRQHIAKNADKSHWEARFRFWLMRKSVTYLSISYFVVFIVLNTIFAALFWIDKNRCCGDATFTFSDVFNFSVQTSTTIGYGSFSPRDHVANFLVLILSYISTILNTIFAGLLFTKFVTPSINIQFSDVMVLCNVNGVPCLTFRLGAPDVKVNPLTDINVRLTYSYRIPYKDHKGGDKFFQQTEDLRLLSNRQHGLKEPWRLMHVLDESSPLFGLNFDEHPGDKIYVFTLTIDAVQDLTKSSVNVQTEYALEDIMIGHGFQSMRTMTDEKIAISDYAKLSDTEPYPVWYPARAGAYVEEKITPSSVRNYPA